MNEKERKKQKSEGEREKKQRKRRRERRGEEKERQETEGRFGMQSGDLHNEVMELQVRAFITCARAIINTNVVRFQSPIRSRNSTGSQNRHSPRGAPSDARHLPFYAAMGTAVAIEDEWVDSAI